MSRIALQEPRPSLGLVLLTSIAVLAVVFVGLVVPAASAAGLEPAGVSAPANGDRKPSSVTPETGAGRCSTLYGGNSIRRICVHRIAAR